MALAVVSVFLASLAALGAAGVSAAVDVAAVEDVLVAAGADAVAVVAAAIVVKLINPEFSPCGNSLQGLFLFHSET